MNADVNLLKWKIVDDRSYDVYRSKTLSTYDLSLREKAPETPTTSGADTGSTKTKRKKTK